MYIIFQYSEGPSIGYIKNRQEAEEYTKLTNTYFEELKEIQRYQWPEKVKFIQATFTVNTNNTNIPLYSFDEVEILDTQINMYNEELLNSQYIVRKNYFNCSKDEAEKDFRAIVEDEKNGFTVVKNIHKWAYVVKKSELQNLVKKDIGGEECWGTAQEWKDKENQKTTSGIWTSGGYGFVSMPYTINRRPADLYYGNRNNNVYVDTEARNEILSWPTNQPIGTILSGPTNDQYVTIQLSPGMTNTNT